MDVWRGVTINYQLPDIFCISLFPRVANLKVVQQIYIAHQSTRIRWANIPAALKAAMFDNAAIYNPSPALSRH